ncbi:hypothetical protein TRFO_30641 [Tritrichomonas foetus]|uniref:Uncharacterized protein n=1 Tax=Tritrichomonas foetus TaxID=1144522 RepID=A0A1J4JU84_9EUKA|nr:hypothetical protein TRFO_30641 [Tritrichomonas foetus]|eukprot:OHT02274.1 hypothetical protein TRFO_30641 [Tritrichomonas foetus]
MKPVKKVDPQKITPYFSGPDSYHFDHQVKKVRFATNQSSQLADSSTQTDFSLRKTNENEVMTDPLDFPLEPFDTEPKYVPQNHQTIEKVETGTEETKEQEKQNSFDLPKYDFKFHFFNNNSIRPKEDSVSETKTVPQSQLKFDFTKAENEGSENEGSGNEGSENEGSENEGSENEGSENEGSENEGSENENSS